MIKKTAALILAACTVAATVPQASAAVNRYCGSNAMWTLSAGTLTVTGKGAMYNYDSAQDVPWSGYASEIKKVVIANGITTVGANTFAELPNLTEAELPAGIVSIGDAAFCSSNLLYSVQIPESTEYIGAAAFRETAVDCADIPQSTTYIGSYAFADNLSLETVFAGTDIEYMGADVFKNTAWESTLPDGCTYISDILYKYNGSGTSVVLESSTEGIAGKAFENSNVTEVKLNDGLKFIGDSAFNGCAHLTSIDIPASVESIAYAAFASTGLRTVVIPDSVTSLEGTFSGCKDLSEVDLGKVSELGDFTFFGCSSLENISLVNITSIGDFAFAFSGIASVTLPSELEYAGEFLFYSCKQLADVTISEGLTEIPSSMFSACTAISEITVPTTVTAIDNYAFSGCKSLEKILIPLQTVSIADKALAASNPVIYGYSGSVAQAYASANGLRFYDINSEYAADGLYVKQGAFGTGTAENPFSTIEQAIAALNGKSGTVYIIGDYNITSFNAPAWQGTVEICGYDSTSMLILDKSCGVHFKGDVVFKNIEVAAQLYSHFNQVADMTLDLGDSRSMPSMIHAGNYSSAVTEGKTITVESGNYGTISLYGAYISDSSKSVVNGDMNFVMNGGSISLLKLCADAFNDNHRGMTINGNANLFINGGIIESYTTKEVIAPIISGALNAIYSGGTSAPADFTFPEAAGGEYIITVGAGGKVEPTATPGLFNLVPDEGKIAVINGAEVSESTVTLAEGNHTVSWQDMPENITETYYVTEGGTGDGSLDAPFGTISEVVEALDGKDGIAYVVGEYEIYGKMPGTAWDGKLIITAYDETSFITSKPSLGVVFRGETELRDIPISMGSTAHFNPYGKKFVLNIGDGNEYNSFAHITSYGNATLDSGHTVVESGYYATLHFGGGYATSPVYGVYNDALLEVNGGEVNALRISADSYMSNHTGITIGGDANIIINGGKVITVNYAENTAPEIIGALNIVFNNDTAQHASTILYPETAAGGTYVIKSGIGGKVLPTADHGVFELIPDPGYVAVVDGKRTSSKTVTVYPGETEISWSKLGEYDTSYTLALDKTQLSLSVNEAALLECTLTPTVDDYLPDHDIMWKSSDNRIASVSGGKVVGISVGTATVRAQSPDGTVYAECAVEVTEEYFEITSVNVTKASGAYAVTTDISGSRGGKLMVAGYCGGAMCDVQYTDCADCTVKLYGNIDTVKVTVINNMATLKPLCYVYTVQAKDFN